MNIKTLKNKLYKLGFSEKEAEVYLTLLQIGESTVLSISRACSIKRSTIYSIIDTLEKRGLVRLVLEGSKSSYVSEHPRSLEVLIEQQRKELQDFLPELEDLYVGDTSENAIKFYRGKEAMYVAYNNLLKSLKPSDDYLVFGDIQSWHDTDPNFFTKWPLERKKIIRQGKSIFTESLMAQEFLKKQGELETTVKILSSKKEFNAIKLITSRHIFLHKTKEPYLVIVIENPSVVKLYKEMFEVLWESIA